MKVTNRVVSALAALAALNIAIHMDITSPVTWLSSLAAGFVAVFPVHRFRRLYLFVADIRPRPKVWRTTVFADPLNGYPEEEEWRLIGTVTERR